MNCDIVLQYCVFNDYPIWRRNISKYRDKFNKIILYPSRHHGYIDLEKFSRRMLKETWVDPVEIDFGKQDWRQAETDPCLEYVESGWIMFSEQDFFVKDWDKFYKDVEGMMGEYDMFGWWNPTHHPYIHPCCLFIKKELFNKTQKDFRAHPEIPGCDHFAMLTKDAVRLGAKTGELQRHGYIPWENSFHLAGITYPYQNWGLEGKMGRVFGVANLEAFFVYNYWSRKVDVEQNEDYLNLSRTMEKYMIKHKDMKDINPETSKWRKFFE